MIYKKHHNHQKFLYIVALLLSTGSLMACGKEEMIQPSDSPQITATEKTADADSFDHKAYGSAGSTSQENTNDTQTSTTTNGLSPEILADRKARFGQNCIAEQTFEVTLSEYGEKIFFVPFAPSDSNPEFHMEILADRKARFGQNCIAEQTFEVTLSEYGEKIFFVPFAPSDSNPEFHMKLISDTGVLCEIPAYVREGLAAGDFKSLDAVSFYDVNYDSHTDIVLIQTYGDHPYAAVYYGYPPEGLAAGDFKSLDAVSFYDVNYDSHTDIVLIQTYGDHPYAAVYYGYPPGHLYASSDGKAAFDLQESLSRQLSDLVSPLSIPEIRSFLSGGKKNGDFDSYQEAYTAVSKLDSFVSEATTYDLIYVNDDEIPELSTGVETAPMPPSIMVTRQSISMPPVMERLLLICRSHCPDSSPILCLLFPFLKFAVFFQEEKRTETLTAIRRHTPPSAN